MIELQFFTIDDADQLINWSRSAEYLAQWAGIGFTYPLTKEQIIKSLEGANDIYRSESLAFKVVIKETGEIIGHISLCKIDRVHLSARISKVVIGNERVKGKGIGSQMINEILKIGFEELKLHRISLGVFDFNKSAIACYEKAGFKKEGLLREIMKVNNKYWNLIEMSVLDREWITKKQNIYIKTI